VAAFAARTSNSNSGLASGASPNSFRTILVEHVVELDRSPVVQCFDNTAVDGREF
jgi:hypothetical protein